MLTTKVLIFLQKGIKRRLIPLIGIDLPQQLGSTGRILVRESGTEPVIRVMVEAPTKALCQEYVDRVVDTICAQGHCRV